VGTLIHERDDQQFNSALLVSPDGSIQRYDKRLLVVGAEGMYTPGDGYQRLSLRTRDGRELNLGVSICYEMHFPGLPQYRTRNHPELLIHLNNESMYRAYPGEPGHGTWACQYRAIETRTWQLVCATWTRSVVIDPRGKVREILGPWPGTIRVSPERIRGRRSVINAESASQPESAVSTSPAG
jgi:apolipoprotein N-acyltransferase